MQESDYSLSGNEPPDISSGFSDMEDLERARKLISGRNFGRVSKYTRPFSAQFKLEITNRFPVDSDVHEKAEHARLAFVKHHLRILNQSLWFSISMIFVAAMTPAAIGAGWLDSITHRLLQYHPAILLGLILVVSSGAFWGITVVRRKLEFHKLHDICRDIATLFTNRRDTIDKLMMDAGRNVQNRSGSDNWPASAGKWMKILLWRAARWQDLDRFCTAHLWKLRHSIDLFEGFYQILRWAAYAFGFLSLIVLWLSAADEAKNILGVAYLLSMLWMVGMAVLSKKRIIAGNVCDRELEEELSQGGGYTCTHYFDLAAQLVTNLVENICVNDRQKGGNRTAA